MRAERLHELRAARGPGGARGLRVTGEGEIVIDVHRRHNGEWNREDAPERLVSLVHRAAGGGEAAHSRPPDRTLRRSGARSGTRDRTASATQELEPETAR